MIDFKKEIKSELKEEAKVISSQTFVREIKSFQEEILGIQQHLVPGLRIMIKDVDAKIDTQEGKFVESLKELTAQTKAGLEYMEAVRIKTARERSNVQNKVTDLKSMIN